MSTPRPGRAVNSQEGGAAQRRVSVILDEQTAAAVAVLVERFAVPKARLVALAAEIGMDAVGDYLRGLIDRADELRAEASVAAADAAPAQMADLLMRLLEFSAQAAALLPNAAKRADGVKDRLLQTVRARGIADPVLAEIEVLEGERDSREA